MELFLPLVLGHFIADYPLQPGGLVRYKTHHFAGIFLHSLIHLAVTAALILPFLHLSSVWWALGVVFVTHNMLDQSKVTLNKKNKWSSFWLYMWDQLLHIVIIWLLAYFLLTDLTPFSAWPWLSYFTNQTLVSFVLILTLVTYFYDITRWTHLNSKKPRPYKRDYRMMGRNALIVVIAFGVYWMTR